MESIAPQTPIETQRQTAAWFAVNNHSAFNYGENVILWQSPLRLIGKHYWRLTIYRNLNLHGGTPLTGYEWVRRREETSGGISDLMAGHPGSVTPDWPRYNDQRRDVWRDATSDW